MSFSRIQTDDFSDIRIRLVGATTASSFGRSIFSPDAAYAHPDTIKALKKASEWFKQNKNLHLVITNAYCPKSILKMMAVLEKPISECTVPSDNHAKGFAVNVTLEDEKGVEIIFPSSPGVHGEHSLDKKMMNISRDALESLQILKEGMLHAGFTSYDCQWWHFELESQETLCSFDTRFEGMPIKAHDNQLYQDLLRTSLGCPQIDNSPSPSDEDFGHICQRKSLRTFYPKKPSDVVNIVKYAYENAIPLSCRGEGHTAYGQAQVNNGIVVDMSKFNKIVEIQDHQMTVQAGCLWSEAFKASNAKGLTPKVFTDFPYVSVGGTLSLGGFGGQSCRHGAQVDTVISLNVLTPEGKVCDCSLQNNRELFEACLGGLGQYGIILTATIQLEQAPATCMVNKLYYTDLKRYMEDIALLAADPSSSYVEGQIYFNGTGPLADRQMPSNCYAMIELVVYHEEKEQPIPRLLAENQTGSFHSASDTIDYPDFINRLAPYRDFLNVHKHREILHPMCTLLLPNKHAHEFMVETLQTLSSEDIGTGLILFYPFSHTKLTRPLLCTPEDDIIWLLSILPNINVSQCERMLATNQRLYKKALEIGGKQYPIGAIPPVPQGWEDQYGILWNRITELKNSYDDKRLLGTGYEIFSKV
jgi:cytokinin dehydrogenase